MVSVANFRKRTSRAFAMANTHHYKDLQLPQLRGFCLAAVRGFTGAADTLGLSVSAVWQQVRALERQLGAVLLRRRGRAVELTAEGQLLVELIQPHIHGLDSPYTAQALLATLYHVLGIDPRTTLLDHTGRPQYLVDDPQKIAELL
jgi:hypothetical protein